MKPDLPKRYIDSLPADRRKAMEDLRKTILQNLPDGFVEVMAYGMIGYVIPHNLYPAGYHVDPRQPLPFINIASQKNYIALYHMGLYADQELLAWFTEEYSRHCSHKLDMGKSCIRFKKPDDTPLGLIGELVSKISVKDWIQRYEAGLRRK